MVTRLLHNLTPQQTKRPKERDEISMTSNNVNNFWQKVVYDWPVWTKIIGAIVVLCLVIFLVIERGEDVSIGLTGFTATRPETPLERNCRLASQQASALDQEISNEILALEAQVAAKDRELSETRSKCLNAQAKMTHATDVDAVPSHHFSQPQSRCRTEISTSNAMDATYAAPIGDYETALTSAAEDRYDLESKIADKEHLRTQQQQRLDQICFGVVTQDATAKTAHRP